MNTQQKNSDDDRSGIVILPGETTKHYTAMLLQQLAQQTPQSLKTRRDIAAARENMKHRDQVFWSRFAKRHTLIPVEESPATAYEQHLAMIEQEPTKLLRPRHTDAIDISLAQTQVEGKETFAWNPYDLLAEMQCASLPETAPRTARITIQLQDQEPQTLHFVNGILSAQELLETALGEYVRQYNVLPARVRVSPSTLLRMDGRLYWTQGETTYYRSKHYGPCSVQIDITLDHMTVQCEEAEYS